MPRSPNSKFLPSPKAGLVKIPKNFKIFPKFFQNFKNGAGPKNSLVHPKYVPRSKWGLASSLTGNSQVYHTLLGTFVFIQTGTDPTAV